MTSSNRPIKKYPQSTNYEKIANELKLTDKFQRLSKIDDNFKNKPNREEQTIYENSDFDIEIHEAKNYHENLFHPIETKESLDYETCILPIRPQPRQIKQPIQQQYSDNSNLSKTPDSIDETHWLASGISSSNSSNLNIYRTHCKSNSNSSVSPSSESLKRGAISSGVGTQSDNEQIDDYSTDDIADDIEIVNEEEEEEDDDDVEDDNDEEGDGHDIDGNLVLENNDEQHHHQFTRQLIPSIITNNNISIFRKAPIPPPKLNEIQMRLNDFLNTIISSQKSFCDKLTFLVNFRHYLDKNCIDVSNSDLNVLFTHVEQIHEQHQLFIKELRGLLTELLNSDLLNLLLKSINIFNIMLINSLKLYLEFLNNYPKAMIILNKFENYQTNVMLNNLKLASSPSQSSYKLTSSENNFYNNQQLQHQQANKRKSFKECENEYGLNHIFYTTNESFDTAKIFSDDLLKNPLELVKHTLSLKEVCNYFIQFTKKQLRVNEFNGEYELNNKIKQFFDTNSEYNSLKEDIFTKIDRILLPNRLRKNDDVAELCENNEKKLRHLILYGDCLICCRIKKEKKQLKWFIPMDRLEIHLGESNKEKKTDKNENDLKNLRDEVASLSGDLRRQNEHEVNSTVKRATVKLQKKLDEQQTELQLKLSTFKLIIRNNHASIANSLLNIPNSMNASTTSIASSTSSAHKNEIYQFLFTSDFERISWLEEINGAIYAYKSRKTTNSFTVSDIEARINNLQKIGGVETPLKKNSFVTCTGTLELLIKNLEGLVQSTKVFVSVELKSFGSYLQVAQTKCTEYTTKPQWDEQFTLELQCVDSIRIILYCETSGKPLAIASNELKIDPKNFQSTKTVSIKLNNHLNILVSMKFLSPKKTITRRRTRNKTDLFGTSITEVLQKEKTTIPTILKDCVEVIETKGIDEIGIFRVSAVVSEVQKMKELYSKNPKVAQQELRQKSPHLAASLLKLYLRELPEPLFTTHLYPNFIYAIENYNGNVAYRDNLLCETFNKLPEANKTILIFILNHLHNIANNSTKNKMDCRNLTTLFGPTLMKLSPKDKLEADNMAREISESTQQASVLYYILKLHAQEKLVHYGKNDHDKDFNNNNNNILINNNQRMKQTQEYNNLASSQTPSGIYYSQQQLQQQQQQKLQTSKSSQYNKQTAL